MTRYEFETDAAMFECDPESAWMQPLDGGQIVSFGSMFSSVQWTNDISAHIDAPSQPFSDSDYDREWSERFNAQKAEERATQPNPVVYRVKITIEYEPLSPDESAKAIAEARKRDIERTEMTR